MKFGARICCVNRSRILPPTVLDFHIEELGVGDGTVFAFRMLLGGRERAFRMRARSGEDGQMIEERDLDSGMVVRWRLRTTNDGHATRARIEVSWVGDARLRPFDRLVLPRAMRRLARDMLQRLGPAVREASRPG